MPAGVAGPDPVTFDVHAFVVRDGDDVILVDALLQPGHVDLIAEALARAGAGFEAIRPLELLEGTLGTRTVEPLALDVADLAAAHHRCSAVARPTWRRELPTVLDALTHENACAIGVRRGDTVVAYAVLPEPARHDGTLLDAAAVDEEAAQS